MSRRKRSSLINPDEINIVHAVAKTVRNLFLIGEDFSTNSDYSHRKDWVFSIMEFQASLMAVDILDFAIMSNHLHFVLRSRPDIVKAFDDQEVARRWLTLCPRSRRRTIVDGKAVYVPNPPSPEQIAELANNKDEIKKIRQQLSSISWWMRLLCQKVAQRANYEDGISMGHFFKGRFHATLINDEPHLLGCSVYVDLNAIKAAMAETLDGYEYVSASVRIAQIRLRMMAKHQAQLKAQEQQSQDDSESADTSVPKPEGPPAKLPRTDFLSPIKLRHPSHIPELHTDGHRCSDKGFLDLTDTQYIDLLEWCITNKILDRRREVPDKLPACLETRGVTPDLWVTQVRDFDTLYRYEAGVKPEQATDSPVGPKPQGS